MDTPENIKFINENQSTASKLRILKQLGMRTTPEDERELNFWDKKRWLVLEDFWAERMTKEHAEELLEKIDNDQERAKA